MKSRAVLAILSLLASLAASVGAVTGGGPANARPAPDRQAAPSSSQRASGERTDEAFGRRLASAAPDARMRVIVIGVTSARAHSLAGAFALRHRLPIIDGFSATMTAAQVRHLARQPGVRRIDPVTRVHALDDGTSHDFGVNAARVDRQSLTGAGIGICIVDTGVNPNHEQIAPRSVTFKDFIGTRTTAYDDHGHGTHVSAIAAGDGTGESSAATTFQGVAPGASLYAAKVLNSSGSGPNDTVVAGVQWCAAQSGVRVISLSLGDDTIVSDGQDPLSVAVNAAVAGGDVVTVAAGNSGDQPGTISSPGGATGAITVGAVSDYSNPAGTDRHDDGIWLAAFSSRGPTADGRTKPDIAAPGVTVRSAQASNPSGYVTFSGTSMATPFVAGAVALGLQVNQAATPAQVKAALASSAHDVGAAGTDNEYGAGYIDVRAFVDTLTGTATVRHIDFPVQQRVSGTVPNNGSYDVPVVVPSAGVGVPLAATVTIAGQVDCPFFPWCFTFEWSPDLDVQLNAPNGSLLQTSECALDGLSCGVGRQETIGFTPTVAGTYVLHVYAFTGEPNNGLGGSFTADISQGPVGAGSPPPPPPANTAPVASAGPDQSVKVKGKTASFTLNGSASYDPDGDPLTFGWRNTSGAVVGTAAQVTLKRALGTWTFTLTVADGRGGTSTDQVTVVLHK